MPTARRLRVPPRFPNRLKVARNALRVTQEQLVELCGGLAKADPGKYSTISISTVRALEGGHQRPQLKKATTLAAALDAEIDQIFPLGADDPNHNPQGVTQIPEDRKKGGRPRSQ